MEGTCSERQQNERRVTANSNEGLRDAQRAAPAVRASVCLTTNSQGQVATTSTWRRAKSRRGGRRDTQNQPFGCFSYASARVKRWREVEWSLPAGTELHAAAAFFVKDLARHTLFSSLCHFRMLTLYYDACWLRHKTNEVP